MSPATRWYGDFRDALQPGHPLRGPERHGLDLASILRAIAADPGTHAGQGALRALATRVTDQSAAEVSLIAWLRAQPVRPVPATPARNPAKVADAASRPGEPLSPADVAWVQMLDAGRLDDATVAQLAELEAGADDAGRRLLAQVLGPARARLDLAAERAELNAEVAAFSGPRANLGPAVLARWREVAGDRLAGDRLAEMGPQLRQLRGEVRDATIAATEDAARAEAGAMVDATAAELRAADHARVQAAQARLAALAAGAPPVSSAPPARDLDPDGDRGRRRAAEVAARRQAVTLDPIGAFR